MTYYGSKELAASFRTVRNNTLTIAREIPEDKYSFSPASGSRTVAQTLVHISTMNALPMLIHGANRLQTLESLNFMQLMGEYLAEENKPRTKAEIIELLTSGGDRFAAFLEGIPEEVLAESVSMPPGMSPASKTRFEMLLGAKEHEMHHRAQLMTAERILGITPHLTRHMQERIAAMQAQAAKA